MFKKATRQQLKDHNTRLILRAIYEGGPLSRADLARATRLTRPTVSSLVSDLLAEGLIVETGRGPSAGGKPPRLLMVDPDARHVLCVDAGNQEFRAALINLRGEIVARRAAPAGHLTGEQAIRLIFDLIEQLLSAATAPLLGIGLGSRASSIQTPAPSARRSTSTGTTSPCSSGSKHVSTPPSTWLTTARPLPWPNSPSVRREKARTCC